MRHMRQNCEDSKQNGCDWSKCKKWKKCDWKKKCAPEDRRYPGREPAFQKKCEMKCKKQEIREQKQVLKEKKKELKCLKKEMKKLKKEAKKEIQQKKEKFAAKVVAHLDTEETSVQKAGASALHQWKVKNTGTQSWTGDVLATFQKGNKSIVAEGFEVLEVGTVQPGHVCYLPCMLNVPELAGTYTAIFRLTTTDGLSFGEPLRVVIEVEDEQPPKYEEVLSEPESNSFTSVPGSNIPKTIEDVPESAPEEPQEVKEEAAPAEPFAFAAELQQLKDMGFTV